MPRFFIKPSRVDSDKTSQVGEELLNYKLNYKRMSKLKLLYSSRTFWTVVVLFLFNGFQAIASYFSPNLVVLINGLLGILVAYFKVNPSQSYQ